MMGYRKLTATLAGIAAATLLAWFGKLDGPAATVIGSIVGSYLAINVATKQRAAT